MAKKRVHEIAKEQGLTSKEVIKALTDAGVYVRAASSAVEERDIRRAFPNGAKAAPAPEPAPAPQESAVEEEPAAEPAAPAKRPRAKAVKAGGRAATPDAAEAAKTSEAAPAPKAKAAAPKPKAPPAPE